MPFYNPSTATATVAANTNVVTLSGIDLTTVTIGMTISFGSRSKVTGDQYLIAAVAPNGTTGGTITTLDNLPAMTNAPFIIDTTGFLGTDATYLIQLYLAQQNVLNTLFGPNTNLFSGSRQLAFDKSVATALSRLMFATGGRTWGDLAHRTLTYTPAGGAQTSTETLSLRAFLDGTTATDAVLIDLGTGGVDVRKASATMVSAATVDLSSAPMAKVALTGSANIVSFGPGKHLDRLMHVVDGGGTLTHNATTLFLPNDGANIVMRAGDCFHATSDGSGNWRVRSYDRADGTPLKSTSVAAANITDASANGRSILTAANYAAIRTLLGLVLGTDVQPFDQDLAAVAALTTTNYGRNLLTLNDEAAARVAIGLNSVGAVSFRNRIRNSNFVTNLRAVSGTVTLSAGQYGHDGFKAGANGCTYTFAKNNAVTTFNITAGTLTAPIEGALYVLEGGTYTLSWVGTAPARVYQGAASGSYGAGPQTVLGLAPETNTVAEWGVGTLSLPQFEPGAKATTFERRDGEARRNLRHQHLSLATAGNLFNANFINAAFPFPETMAFNPTATVFSGTAKVDRPGVATYSVTGINNVISASPDSALLQLNTDGTSTGICNIYPNTLVFRAEL